MRLFLAPLVLFSLLFVPACDNAVPRMPDEDAVGPAPAAEITIETPTVPAVKTDDTATRAKTAKTAAPKTTPTPTLAETTPSKLNLSQAVLAALADNTAFRIERLRPAIRRTYEAQERADFDPSLSADLSRTRSRTDEDERHQTAEETTHSETTAGGVTLREFLPTGTTLQLDADRTLSRTDSPTSESKGHETDVDITVTQSLLRGFGPAVNLARLRQARLDTRISQYELRVAAENLVTDVEETYWDYVLAERSITIYTRSLKIAEQSIAEVKERIRIGKVAETELAAAAAEVAHRREELINARSQLAKTRLSLLRLLGPTGPDGWNRQLELSEKPEVPQSKLDDVEAHVRVALRQRPDLNEARLELRQGDLEVVRTRNGLLPKLDLFIRLGRSRYADSFRTSNDQTGKSKEVAAGVEFEYALGHRSERAAHDRALFSREQTREALTNMEQLVQVDVRSAYVEVGRANEQIEATKATRKLREEALRSEQEKFRVGRSTTLLVSQAWRDLVASQIAELEAIIGYRKALLQLYRLEGSLLERRGIRAPGRTPAIP